MLTYQETYIELICDQCQTCHIFEAGVDYLDFQDFLGLMEFKGWKNTWMKDSKHYIHICSECVQRHRDYIEEVKRRVKQEFPSIAEAKEDY